ncbi:MAG: M23 family metallopeptidase, partial [Gammaproteobacteria bacterium]|nr:M23 family metallopeptidase [Gammaproteobacteria bacterium]
GEDPWMSAVLIMAGIINGENNRSMLGEHLLEEFSNWFKVILASNVADIRALDSPVGNAPINSVFRADRTCTGCSADHLGTDYAVPIGTSVVATASGKVVRAYVSATFGNTVIVDHGPSSSGNGNVYTLYAHGDKLVVREGQEVAIGQEILISGNSGNSTGPHLHYEVIQTVSKPTESGFYGKSNERYSPTDLKKLL